MGVAAGSNGHVIGSARIQAEIEDLLAVVASLEPDGVLPLVIDHLASTGHVTLTWQDPLRTSPPLAELVERLQPALRPALGPLGPPGSGHPLWPGAAGDVESCAAPVLASLAAEHGDKETHDPPRAHWASGQLMLELLVLLALAPSVPEVLDERDARLMARVWQQVRALATTPADRVDILRAIVRAPWTAGASAAREYTDHLAQLDLPSGVVRWDEAVVARLKPFDQIHLDMLVILRRLWLGNGLVSRGPESALTARRDCAEALDAVRAIASAAGFPSASIGSPALGVSLPYGPVAAAGRLGLAQRWEMEVLRCRHLLDRDDVAPGERAVAGMVLAPGFASGMGELITTIGLLFLSGLIADHLPGDHRPLLDQMWDDVVSIASIPAGKPTETAATLVSFGWEGTGRELASDALLDPG